MPCAALVIPDGLVRNYGYGYPPWFGNGYRAPWLLMPNPSMFVPLPSPWNAAVAEERAKLAARPRPTLSLGTQAELQTLAAEREAAYEFLRNAPTEDKAEARKDWIPRTGRPGAGADQGGKGTAAVKGTGRSRTVHSRDSTSNTPPPYQSLNARLSLSEGVA